MEDASKRLRLRLAEAEAEVASLRDEVERLASERARLARKNERLTIVLDELRALRGITDPAVQRIEDALAYDGRDELSGDTGWTDFDLVPNEEPDGESDA
jgi:predicted nuclease with TOPRIM domain